MSTFQTSRKIAAPIESVFAAISTPERLARWWGPEGFTNTFEICEFKPGGLWKYIMHGPDGRDYPNETVFAEIESPKKVVIQHASLPKYTLVITLASEKNETLVSWAQTFDKPEVAKAIAHIVVPANEQNLDRLIAEVTR
ncbi:SRPBCC family protein [Bdellovibrio reynosensis]|uniref:SRPBCC family protein n=1 Tax=Bdellovibrio reynosensis TaxID=2835041 RepID=A0ABY4C7E0_9BACT|nr:SRPBCC family protein [Bdellovibrio reynosensis]UOF00624.1 SRPBCC family protein [Bdellovibrio reynosensis]